MNSFYFYRVDIQKTTDNRRNDRNHDPNPNPNPIQEAPFSNSTSPNPNESFDRPR